MEKKSKEEELNWKKNNISQIEIEGWNWNQIKISQRVKKKNLEIKIIRIEIEILINKRTTLKFSMANVNFKGGEKKEKKKRKHGQRHIVPPPTIHVAPKRGGCRNVYNDTVKRHFCSQRGTIRATQRARTPPTRQSFFDF
jgi:hypothetical protein